MTSFSFAVVAAVSTEAQATEDRDSIPYQLKAARLYGEKQGGEFIKEYIADGFSRSGYFDLSQALEAIPAFGELAKDARNHLFDVILLESYDRLGDIGYMLFNYLSYIGAPYIQLRSVQQSLPIEDPKTYHPRKDDSTPTMINNSLTINRYRTSKIVRAFEVGVNKRARDGKYSRRLPRGYRFIGTRTEYRVELDPAFKAKLIDAKNKYLQGWTLPALEELTGWKRSGIKEMLRNPWYAGKTFVDRGYTAPSGTWKIKEEPVPLYDGKHEACWNMETYYLLVKEIDRRGKHLRHKRAYPLTGLVVCARCNRHMHILPARNQNYQYYTYYRCRGCELSIRENVVMEEFVKALRKRMAEFQDAPLEAPEAVDNSHAIAALRKQLEKVRIAYETTDSYSAEEYAARKREITKDIAKLEDVEHQQEEQVREREQRRGAIETVRELLPHIETWMKITPAGEVNVMLSQAVQCVTIGQDKTVDVTLW